MNNVINISCGNDSKAMLIRIHQLRQQDPDYFNGDTWSAVYCHTGWARTGWEKEVNVAKKMCEKFGFNFYQLQHDARNQSIQNANDDLFAMLPDTAHFGLIAEIKKQAFFPHVGNGRYCTEKLKIIPIKKFLKKHNFNHKNTLQWLGIRREEGRNKKGGGGTAGIDRANITSVGIDRGFNHAYPLAYMTSIERDKLLTEYGIKVYHSRSEECYPCIFQCSFRQLADLDDDKVQVIHDLESKITKFRHAKYKLMGIKKNKWEFFGMFNYKSCGNQQGIKKQVAWAKAKLARLNAEPKQQKLFADDMIIDDKCKSGACGL